MLCGPEMARVICEFERSMQKSTVSSPTKHHGQTRAAQSAFARDTMALKKAIEDMGNPFNEQSTDLLILDTRDIVENEVKEAISGLAMLGRERYDKFFKERLELRITSIDDPIKSYNVQLFKKGQ